MQEQTYAPEYFEKAIWKMTGDEHSVREVFLLSGGFHHQSAKVATDRATFFLKWSELPESEQAFNSEATGLRFLADRQILKVPAVLGCHSERGHHFLLMEYLRSKPMTETFWANLGSGLANLHRSQGDAFGFSADTYYLGQRQANASMQDWAGFYLEKRLRPQFGWAYYNGRIDQKYMHQLDRLSSFFSDYIPTEPPALLHGNFWSGNVMALGKERHPALFNPAVYFGHREMDLAHALLLGSPEAPFWESYRSEYPLQPHFEERLPLLQLYPLIAHVNAHGPSYLSAIDATFQKFLG